MLPPTEVGAETWEAEALKAGC
eukprot:SAG11_NODE_10176_length_849_cov_1.341333_1_plen_21_part_10